MIAVAGCEPPPPLLEVAPYCALARPCVTDNDCATRFAPGLPTCDDGLCVTEYACRSDADCTDGLSCRLSDPRRGIGAFLCVRACALDSDCAPDEVCSLRETCVLRREDCLREGCERPGEHCVPWERGIYSCVLACGSDADCSDDPFAGAILCVAGSCFSADCIDGLDFSCGAGNVECRNARPLDW